MSNIQDQTVEGASESLVPQGVEETQCIVAMKNKKEAEDENTIAAAPPLNIDMDQLNNTIKAIVAQALHDEKTQIVSPLILLMFPLIPFLESL